jgi:hypothetical protein
MKVIQHAMTLPGQPDSLAAGSGDIFSHEVTDVLGTYLPSLPNGPTFDIEDPEASHLNLDPSFGWPNFVDSE